MLGDQRRVARPRRSGVDRRRERHPDHGADRVAGAASPARRFKVGPWGTATETHLCGGLLRAAELSPQRGPGSAPGYAHLGGAKGAADSTSPRTAVPFHERPARVGLSSIRGSVALAPRRVPSPPEPRRVSSSRRQSVHRFHHVPAASSGERRGGQQRSRRPLPPAGRPSLLRRVLALIAVGQPFASPFPAPRFANYPQPATRPSWGKGRRHVWGPALRPPLRIGHIAPSPEFR